MCISCYYHHDHKVRYFLCLGLHVVAVTAVALIPFPIMPTHQEYCSTPLPPSQPPPLHSPHRFSLTRSSPVKICSNPDHLIWNSRLPLVSFHSKWVMWQSTFVELSWVQISLTYNIVTFRCSNKDDNEADRNCSTSPAPSHSCDTISEEPEDTTIANTSTAILDTQQQV